MKAMDSQTETWDFADLRLKPGEFLSMQIAGHPAQHKIQFIGALPKKSLVTTIPKDIEDLMHKPQVHVVMRGLANTHAYAFNCQPLVISYKPYAHMHFSYPELAMVKQARRYPRVAVKLPVEVANKEGAIQLSMLVDISAGGAGIHLDTPLWQTGDEIKVGVPIILEKQVKLIWIPAHIVRLSGETQSGYHYGVEFKEISNDDALLLHAFVDHLMAIKA